MGDRDQSISNPEPTSCFRKLCVLKQMTIALAAISGVNLLEHGASVVVLQHLDTTQSIEIVQMF